MGVRDYMDLKQALETVIALARQRLNGDGPLPIAPMTAVNVVEDFASSHANRPMVKGIETCHFIPVTSLFPESWQPEIFEVISDNAPFTWGDNNRSLVTIERFFAHIDDRFICFLEMSDGDEEADETMREWEEFKEMVKGLDPLTYIDMEN